MKHVVAALVVVFVAVECMPSKLGLGIPDKNGGKKGLEFGYDEDDGVQISKTGTEVKEEYKENEESSKSYSNHNVQNGDHSSSEQQSFENNKKHSEHKKTTKESKQTLSLGGKKGVKATEHKKETEESDVKDHVDGKQSHVKKDKDGKDTYYKQDESEYSKDSEVHDKTTEEEDSEMGFGLNGKSKVKKDKKKSKEHSAVNKESGSEKHLEAGHSEKDGHQVNYVKGAGKKYSKSNAESESSDTQTHKKEEYDRYDQREANKGYKSRIPAEVVRELNKKSRKLGMYGGRTQALSGESVEHIQSYPSFAGLRDDYLLSLAKKIFNTKIVNISGQARIVDASLPKSRANSRTSHSQAPKPLPVSSQYSNMQMIKSKYNNIPSFYVPGAKYSKLRYGNEEPTGNIQDGIGNKQDGTAKSEYITNKIYSGGLQLSSDRNRAKVERDHGNSGGSSYKRKPTIAPDVRNVILSQNIKDFIKNLDSSRAGSKSATFSEINKKNNLFSKINFSEILKKSKESDANIYSDKNKGQMKEVKEENDAKNSVYFNGLGKSVDNYDDVNYDDGEESSTFNAAMAKSTSIDTNAVKNKKSSTSYNVGIYSGKKVDSNDELKVSTEKSDAGITNDEYKKYAVNIYVNKDDSEGSDEVEFEVRTANGDTKGTNFSKIDIDSDLNERRTNFNQSADDSINDVKLNLENNTSPSPHNEKYDNTQLEGPIDEIDIIKSNKGYTDNTADINENNEEYISEKRVDTSDSEKISSSDVVDSRSNSIQNYDDDNVIDTNYFSTTESTTDKNNSSSTGIYDDSQFNAGNLKVTDSKVDINNSMPLTYSANVSSVIILDDTSTEKYLDSSDYDDLRVIGIEKTIDANAFTTEKAINSNGTTISPDNYSKMIDVPPASMMNSDILSTESQTDLHSNIMPSETTNESNISDNITDIIADNSSDNYLENKSFDSITVTDIATSTSADDLIDIDSSTTDRFLNTSNFTTQKMFSEMDTSNVATADKNTEKTHVISTTSTVDSTIDIPDNKSDDTLEAISSSVTPVTADMKTEGTEITHTTAVVDNYSLVKSVTTDATRKVNEESKTSDKNSNTDMTSDTMTQYTNTSNKSESKSDGSSSRLNEDSSSITSLTNTDTSNVTTENAKTNANINVTSVMDKPDTDTSVVSDSKLTEEPSSSTAITEAFTSNVTSAITDKNNTDVTSDNAMPDTDSPTLSDSKLNDSLRKVTKEYGLTNTVLMEVNASSVVPATPDKITDINLTPDTTIVENDSSNSNIDTPEKSDESGSSTVLTEVNTSSVVPAKPDKSTDIDVTPDTAIVENDSSNSNIDTPEKSDTISEVTEESSSSTVPVNTDTDSDIAFDTVADDSVTAVSNSKPDDTSIKMTAESTAAVINSDNDNGNSNAGTLNSNDTFVSASVSTTHSVADGNIDNSPTTNGAGDKYNAGESVKPETVLESAEESKSDESASRSSSDEPTMLAGLDLMNQSAYESGSVSSESSLR